MEFQIIARGYHHGQSDLTLVAKIDGKTVGRIDYSDYDGQPAVQMIEAYERGQGIGPALVRRLQAEYPGVEINFGMLTADGAQMLRKLPMQRIANADYRRLQRRLSAIRRRVQEYQAKSDAFDNHPTDEARIWFNTVMDRWNALQSEIWELEQRLRHMKPSKRLIAPKD